MRAVSYRDMCHVYANRPAYCAKPKDDAIHENDMEAAARRKNCYYRGLEAPHQRIGEPQEDQPGSHYDNVAHYENNMP